MRRLAALLLVAVLAACAGPAEKPVLRLGLDARAETKRLMWPSETTGEVPRYFYVGELTGEDNFTKPESSGNKALGFLARMLDIIVGEAPPLKLDRPQSGAADDSGRIFVTDTGRGGVFVFDEAAGKLNFWGKADGVTGFVSPVAVAVGSDGDIFVTDAELGIVAHLDRRGETLAPLGRGELLRPTGLAFEPKSRRLFVADTQAHQVKVFSPEGKLLSTIGERGEKPGQFNYPTHIAVRHEKLFVSDSLNARVQVISTPTGRYLGTVGERGLYLGNLVRPKGVAVDSEHNLYVVESYHDYLLIYNRRGEFLLPIGGVGGGPGSFHLPSGVWIDVRNRIFVADTLNSRVVVFQFLGGEDNDEER
jgi:DNA-binding beta-propeller fold protein YncE